MIISVPFYYVFNIQAYVDGGFALKDAHAQYMQNMLQSDLTLAISTLIEKLTSTEMHTLSSQTSAPRFRDSMSEIVSFFFLLNIFNRIRYHKRKVYVYFAWCNVLLLHD